MDVRIYARMDEEGDNFVALGELFSVRLGVHLGLLLGIAGDVVVVVRRRWCRVGLAWPHLIGDTAALCCHSQAS